MRLFMGTPYSHAYIQLYFSKFDRHIIYESSHGNVHFKELNYWKDTNTIIYERKLNITDESYIKLMQFCIDNSNKPYSTCTLFDIVLGTSFCSDGKKAFICSELVARALGLSSDDKITPKEVYDLLLKIENNSIEDLTPL